MTIRQTMFLNAGYSCGAGQGNGKRWYQARYGQKTIGRGNGGEWHRAHRGTGKSQRHSIRRNGCNIRIKVGLQLRITARGVIYCVTAGYVQRFLYRMPDPYGTAELKDADDKKQRDRKSKGKLYGFRATPVAV